MYTMLRLATELTRPTACEPFYEDPPARTDASAYAGPTADLQDLSPASEVGLLYRRHHGLVFRLALRYGRGDVAWAEDVTQDVFVGLFKVVRTLSDLDDLEGWLYRTTTNRCLNRLRRDRFLGLAPVRWLLGERQAEPRRPDELAVARDELRRAFDVLGELPPKERVAFSMYYLDEKEQEEIGRVLGHSKSYVCKLIQRATARLKVQGWEV